MIAAVQLLLLSLFPTLVVVAALRDATSMTIPNWISLALLAGYLPAAFACGLAPMTLAVSLGFGVGALAIGVAMFLIARTSGAGLALTAKGRRHFFRAE